MHEVEAEGRHWCGKHKLVFHIELIISSELQRQHIVTEMNEVIFYEV